MKKICRKKQHFSETFCLCLSIFSHFNFAEGSFTLVMRNFILFFTFKFFMCQIILFYSCYILNIFLWHHKWHFRRNAKSKKSYICIYIRSSIKKWFFNLISWMFTIWELHLFSNQSTINLCVWHSHF